jgi:hypothetical protein
MVFTGPVHAKFVIRALDPARATVLEAALGIDARVAAPPLESRALDDTNTLFADFIVETWLIAATAVHDVTICADTGTITVGLVRVGTAPCTISDEIPVREIGVFFATAPCSK